MKHLILVCSVLLTLLLPAWSWAATLVDNFTEASTLELSTHTATPDTGTWTKQLGSAGVQFNVTGSTDRINSTSNDSNLILYTISWTPATASYDVKWTWVTESTGGTPDDDVSGLVARFTDTSNYYYAGFKRGAATPDTYIGKIVAGVRTDLVSGDCGQVNGDILTFVITDAVKKIQVNGADCSGLTTSDNALTSVGVVGVACGNVIAVAGSDCSASAGQDDFTLVDTVAGVNYFQRRVFSQ
jgi:hypothetical protein